MIIVAMTTWAPRLQNIPAVLDSIMRQTMLPDKIVITLSLEEFGGKSPLDLSRYPLAEVLWTQKNTKVWKKLNPVMDIYPDAEIINIDDDVLYPPQFIGALHIAYEYNHRPVTVATEKYRGIYTHLGYASLVTSRMFGFIRPTATVMENVHASDLWYTYVLQHNGYSYVTVPGAVEGRQLLPSPQPYTVNTDINPEWEWMERYYK